MKNAGRSHGTDAKANPWLRPLPWAARRLPPPRTLLALPAARLPPALRPLACRLTSSKIIPDLIDGIAAAGDSLPPTLHVEFPACGITVQARASALSRA